MKIEIVMAYYNGSQFIESQVDSILSNKIAADCELEIIVVDDCSKESEHRFLMDKFGKHPQIRIFRNQNNLGVIKTFERGLTETNSDYVMLSDQDDFWLPNKIAKCLTHIRKVENSNPALVFTNLTPVSHDLKPITQHTIDERLAASPNLKYQILFQNIVPGCATILNRKLIELALPFPSSITMHDHWLSILAAHAGRLEFLPQPLVLYRQHGRNTIGNPKHSLADYLKRPWDTINRLNRTMDQKARQTQDLVVRLSNRLSESEAKRLQEISQAFESRTPSHFMVLLKYSVLKMDFLRYILICISYMLSGSILVREKKCVKP